MITIILETVLSAVFGILIISTIICSIVIYYRKPKAVTENKTNNVIENKDICVHDGYVKPAFKQLTQEQIDDIHARGKITPAEMVKEWEGMDLCAPGDAIGSAAWRCRKFHHNCHDCLVDYANEHDDYTSFHEIMKLCRPFRLRNKDEKTE